MLDQFLIALIPSVCILVGYAFIVATILIWEKKQRNEIRESPLSHELLRPPGHYLQEEIADLDNQLMVYVISALGLPICVYSVQISQYYFTGKELGLFDILVSTSLMLVGLIIVSRKIIKLLQSRKYKKLGRQGEMFVGEELNQLMRFSCRVFHDLETEHGNIDHVVVSPSGVFSVETKAYGKEKEGEDKEKVVVDHTTNTLRFARREFKMPSGQVEGNAKWLSKFLSSSTGQHVPVQPILALPGWYIKETIGRGKFRVISPKNPLKVFVTDKVVYDDAKIEMIADVLERKNRNIKRSYKD